MAVRIAGERMYLWRAVDHEGEVLDSGRRGKVLDVPFRDAPTMTATDTDNVFGRFQRHRHSINGGRRKLRLIIRTERRRHHYSLD